MGCEGSVGSAATSQNMVNNILKAEQIIIPLAATTSSVIYLIDPTIWRQLHPMILSECEGCAIAGCPLLLYHNRICKKNTIKNVANSHFHLLSHNWQ